MASPRQDIGYRLFVGTFVVLLVTAVATSLQRGNARQGAFLTAALLLLTATIVTTTVPPSSPTHIERFSQASSGSDMDTPREDFSEISDGLTTYLSAFDRASLPDDGRTWIDLAPRVRPAAADAVNKDASFVFDFPPMFSRTSGVFMGSNNRLVGPKSDALGIAFHRTFSVVLVVKHGSLRPTTESVAADAAPMEILKLYANSPNNNGLCLRILPASVKTSDNTQTGTLELEYADAAPMACKVDPAHAGIDLNRDLLTFYYIVKDTDHVRVIAMNQANDAMTTILKFDVPTTVSGVTFSNKEMVVNRNLNWNGHVLAMAVYDRALTTEMTSEFHTHVLKAFYRQVDPNLPGLIKKQQAAEKALQDLKSCPFNGTDDGNGPSRACGACGDVAWSDPMQWLTASPECRAAIAEHCQRHSTDADTRTSICRCYDPSYPLYGSPACRMVRAALSDDPRQLWRNLDAGQVADLKQHLGLIAPKDCPACPPPVDSSALSSQPVQREEPPSSVPTTTTTTNVPVVQTKDRVGTWARFVQWIWP